MLTVHTLISDLLYLALLIFTACLFLATLQAQDDEWQKVEEAIRNGLPKTAITHLDHIIPRAIQTKAYGEATKAIARKFALESNIQGNKPEERIVRLEAEITRLPAEMKPVLQAILARWYWHYFQRNKWRFLSRTATAAPPGPDFTTWDLPRLFREIDKYYTLSLSSGRILKATPIHQYQDLLEKGTLPDRYRPTLYDFLAQEALAFYTSGEQAAAKPQDAFEISADGEIFSPAEPFLQWKISTTDLSSPLVKAIQLYQDLMRFHQSDADATVFLDLDLARLQFGFSHAVGEEKTKRYQTALRTLIQQRSGHELSTLAMHQLARYHFSEGEYPQAHRLASQAVKAFPDSMGARMCQELIYRIEDKESRIQVERIWNAPCPQMEITYRNLNVVYFRAVAWNWQESVQREGRPPDHLDDQEREALLQQKPVMEWSASLKPTADFRLRTEKLPAPENLKPGFYFLLTSHEPGFGKVNNQVSFCGFWVSRLALIVRPSGNGVDGFVLEANSGEPIAGAQVTFWSQPSGKRSRVPTAASTDPLGYFRVSHASSSSGLVYARFQDQEILSDQEYYAVGQPMAESRSQTFFFTDRALYRPGQTIYFKGICVRSDPKMNDYRLLPEQSLTVAFLDVNGKDISLQPLRTNAYGSFSGNFQAPNDRLPGAMSLQVRQGPEGYSQIQVEEYKRPKFRVAMEAPKIASRLNEKVSLQGKAESYTGAAIDGAQLKYRVVREVRFPPWYYGLRYRMPIQRSPSQEIAHGTSKTATDGSFTIAFTARPDSSVPESEQPIFTFKVYAEVTDSTGETRTAERFLRLAYTSIEMNVTADEWITEEKPATISIYTTTLDGIPQVLEGTVRICELQAPPGVIRPELKESHFPYPSIQGQETKPEMTDNPATWPLGKTILEKGFATDKNGKASLSIPLRKGIYRALVEIQDPYKKPVRSQLPLHVLQPQAARLSVPIPHLLSAPSWSSGPGQEFLALWGTGYPSGRTFVEIEHRGQIIQRYWTSSGKTQEQIRVPVKESMRGGFFLHLTQVRENRAFLDSRMVSVPWENKDLKIRWERFTDKLQPGAKETWTAVLSGPAAQKAAGEMVLSMYDASLDAFRTHSWPTLEHVFPRDASFLHSEFANGIRNLSHLQGSWESRHITVVRTYRSLPEDLIQNLFGYDFFGERLLFKARREMADGAMPPPVPAPMAGGVGGGVGVMANAAVMVESATGYDTSVSLQSVKDQADRKTPETAKQPDLDSITARKNLQETAFFFPHLQSDAEGVVRVSFTVPEALTTWNVFAFAHDREVRSGFLQSQTITAKELMLQPNPPRFLREGDRLEFTVKVSNQSDRRLEGKISLRLKDAATLQSVDARVENQKPEQSFDIPARESRSLSWRLNIPDGLGYLTYKVVGTADTLSDGEEGWLPVLSRRILVTESLPLSVRGPATKNFRMDNLLTSRKSDTLQHQSLTVQAVSQSAWYAVLALPYLMEFPHECSEQIFNRIYANALAQHIAGSDPKIERIFQQWRNTRTLDSPLEKNQDLKSILLEETPWLRQAQKESEARRRIGVLFEENQVRNELERSLKKLGEMQLADGAWPWFPGGRENDYITLYITAGFGRLRRMGVEIPVDMAVRSLIRLDRHMEENYRRLRRTDKWQEYIPTAFDALYLYGRSFFLQDQPPGKNHQEAIGFYLEQSRKHWLKTASRQTQGHLALGLYRWGGAENKKAAAAILASIQERSVSDEELGRFWRDTELSWWWYHAPIETQALMIEAFHEISANSQLVEECQIWLLKQKQTQNWKTTKATADAVYALLLSGKNLLSSDALVQVSLGSQPIQPSSVEAGTGFFEKRFSANEIQAEQGQIQIKKTDAGISWGGVYWQYLEDIARITPQSLSSISLEKSLFRKINTAKGPVLEAYDGSVSVGEELVVRLILKSDRDLEYVHLKDGRGSGTEPVNVLSGYRYQDGLAYYENTRDTAGHFFIDYLPKGTYIFEYPLRVQLRGDYQTGMAHIQCMYAPEFGAHSGSILLQVK